MRYRTTEPASIEENVDKNENNEGENLENNNDEEDDDTRIMRLWF